MAIQNPAKGNTLFRNLYIGWYYTPDFGLTVTEIRCGVCRLPVQPIAIQVGDTVYMTCTDGHLVGTETDPNEAQKQLHIAGTNGQVQRFTNRQTHNNNMFAVIQQFKAQFDIEQAIHF